MGLTTNGYSTVTSLPFPLDAISQVVVELAPADVTYGGFATRNINAVTKSGRKPARRHAFFQHARDSLRNTLLASDPSDFSTPPFNAHKLGATLD